MQATWAPSVRATTTLLRQEQPHISLIWEEIKIQRLSDSLSMNEDYKIVKTQRKTIE